MTHDIAHLESDVRDRLTTLLVQAGHLNHPLRLAAHVETSSQSADEIRAMLKAEIPAHMVPDLIQTTAKLPRLPNGKIDRAALVALSSEISHNTPAPASSEPPKQVQTEDAAHDALETLRAIWADVLGMDQIHDEDDFFEMGGDSLLSISVVSRARSSGLNLIPSDLFDYPVLAVLADRISQADVGSELNAVEAGPLGASTSSQNGDKEIFILNANRRMLDLLNAQLTTPHNLHLLTLHWDSGTIDPRTKMRDLAAEFLAHIREIRPKGPYSIGGFSMGAVLAHEIAHQLRQQGEILDEIILIDPPENPALFAKSYNPDHRFVKSADDHMSVRNRVAQFVVLKLFGLLSFLGLPAPNRLRPRLVVASYFKAARRYKTRAPAIPPIIVRRTTGETTSMWARDHEISSLQEIDCSHRDFYRSESMMHRWTGMLAEALER